MVSKKTNAQLTLMTTLTGYDIIEHEDILTLQLFFEDNPTIVYKIHADQRAAIPSIHKFLEEQLTFGEILIEEFPARNYLYVEKERRQFSGLRESAE